ncbi:hypothetical protein A2851_05415 [Candidatus Kaiserbacteria bacterium RIFCSPHIGHO2_01_FULL_53_29]|uniref:Uncharacterized protein n=1 Tax=Candidatus Kaiserbacteria bacterium RIFCSPHIGHO2_01_FULL_53_29 TaxID=1798480 RepID=A0A1F6CTE6_9BACT|nr:MAG: hypothetical protein A2851_05415 [Candidatus Kaiserbacteria bacterium RIFCSPHIGHO2_01_FULL_53_29]
MKDSVRSATYQLLLLVLATSALFVSLSAFPMKVSALEIPTQTQQVLPPGSNTCAALSAKDFTPYIYNGALHSFEFTIPDASYVALLGSVGNTPLPFVLMTRRVEASGVVRVHVDIATTPIRGTLPLRVTLFSARTGQPVCAAVVSMSVGSGPIGGGSSPITQTPPATPVTYSGSTYSNFSNTSGSDNTTPTSDTTATDSDTLSSASSSQEAETVSATPTSSVVGTMQNTFKSICASDASAYRLWLILLVLYALIVGAALWAEFPMSVPWARTPERIATIILVLLLLLLGFWYFSVSCRAALWMPLVAFLIAVLGLLAAFWNHPRVTQLLLIQDSNL